MALCTALLSLTVLCTTPSCRESVPLQSRRQCGETPNFKGLSPLSAVVRYSTENEWQLNIPASPDTEDVRKRKMRLYTEL